MGGQPSKMSLREKAVMDRLREVKLEDDYVEVDASDEKCGDVRLRREPEGLPLPLVKSWQKTIFSDPKNRLAFTALSSADPRQVLNSHAAEIADQQIYNVKIPFEGGPITNQRSSGRCWLFASTNVFRVAIMQRYNLESFELSQAYLFYWDKLEKCNWFLEQIIDTADEDLDGRLVQALLGDIVSDGGQWDMVHNLVEKYGLVPQSLYPDSWNAMNSGPLNSIVKTKLREFALQLRKLTRSGSGVSVEKLSSVKGKMMQEISLVMNLLLGPPPKPDEEFTWQYADKDGKAHELKIKPKDFAQYINSKSPIMDTLKSACIKMLQAGIPIFFGSDVGKFSDTKSGIMDTSLYSYELGLGSDLLGMSKAERLSTGESQMTHAMVLTAVHIDEETGKPVRWRVQNSWGADAGKRGWFVMGDSWMDEFVYQAVVDARFCSKEVKEVLGKTPIVLPLWDPMGSLA